MSDWRIVPAGDAALTVEYDARIDPVINARVVALAAAVCASAIDGVRDIVPTYRSVTVFFDPLRTDYKALVVELARQAERPAPPPAVDRTPLRIPVCYGGELGPDLEDVAVFGAMDEVETVRLHTFTVYRVFMLGFVPGFAYMGLVDERIAAPRRQTPRVRVPRGSVGIAGRQTGIYPAATPGGWQIVGRTPLRPFDRARREPFLMRAGDAVQFYAIDREEFDRLEVAD
jgi:KipI family sensor histidine kinase inhibitor